MFSYVPYLTCNLSRISKLFFFLAYAIIHTIACVNNLLIEQMILAYIPIYIHTGCRKNSIPSECVLCKYVKTYFSFYTSFKKNIYLDQAILRLNSRNRIKTNNMVFQSLLYLLGIT